MLWTNSEIESFKKDYPILSIEDLCIKYNRTSYSIYYKASALNLSRLEYNRKFMSIKSRKHSFDEYFFEVIDIPEKAYFLGLLYADGYIHVSKKVFMIDLQNEDKYILEKLKYYTKSTYPLYRTGGNINPISGKSYFCYRYSVTSEETINQLKKLGCVHPKPDRINLPNIDENLLPHFIRGFFDGDGSVFGHYTKRNQCLLIISFCSNTKLLKEIDKYLFTKNINTSMVDDKRHENISNLSIRNPKSFFKFMDLIYKDSSDLKLIRKYNRFLNYKEGYDKGFRNLDLYNFC